MKFANFIPFVISACIVNVKEARADTILGITVSASTRTAMNAFLDPERDPECPPCFNCNSEGSVCAQFSICNAFTGQCDCRPGFGLPDCSQPLCGALSDGNPHRPVRDTDDACACSPGWKGINCNVCDSDKACDPFMPQGLEGTCYKQGIAVNTLHQMCDVTNPKIIAILKDKRPYATFSCNNTAAACDFQFWIDQKESFYCSLDQCKLDYDLARNTTHFNCDSVRCECLPGRMLCGEANSIDISEFLTETIRGPGDFTCNIRDKTCRFSEPSMNELISSVFGDPYITLKCSSGECIHRSQIPGYDIPPREFTIYDLLVILSVALVSASVVGATVYNVRKSPLFAPRSISLGNDESIDDTSALDELASAFVPATLTFENVLFNVNGLQILNNILGCVSPRQCLAIMGASGAGKTTLLDILAAKSKTGVSSGDIRVNGNILSQKHFRRMVAFVDQQDHLFPTLTVYETVLNSALLRLPRKMPLSLKHLRVTEVLSELRILEIKDRVVGLDFVRGISGGEKRRLSIACELVTSPSILFLDEPTLGLDSYNARNVIECLVRLAKVENRTIVFTIHQPRSNIVALFDKLLLLSSGESVYLGDMIKCNDYFARIGYRCPLGYNIADYLIDVTLDQRAAADRDRTELTSTEPHSAFAADAGRVNSDVDTTQEWDHLATHRQEFAASGKPQETEPEPLSSLARTFADSDIADDAQREILAVYASAEPIDAARYYYKKANGWTQVMILASRTFKNLYRNPRLLSTQYALSLLVGLFCGYLYYNVGNDISGFQNRLGLFFFALAFFGFCCLSGLYSFSAERIIFVRERANNYYHPLSYYTAKILCDVLPLRVLPPVIFLSIAYPLVGLLMEHQAFPKALLILVLFNVAVAAEMLLVGIMIKDPGASTMVAVLVLLLLLLFAGLFVNSKDLLAETRWLEWVSVFHYAYEALAVNEVKDLVLREKKYGLEIEVPGAVILSSFGFEVSRFWHDAALLGVMCGVFLVAGYCLLYKFTIEKR